MPRLQPYIGGQNYRMTQERRDPMAGLNRLLGQAQKQEAFNQKIKNIEMQNQTDSSVVQYKSDLKLLNDSFDPNNQTPEEHKEKTEELYRSYRENAPFQGDFDNKTLLQTTEGAIGVKNRYEKNVLEQNNSLRAQEYIGIAEEDPRLRVQRATQLRDKAVADNVITAQQGHDELQGASLKMITHDATYNDLDDTINRLTNPKDTKYGDLDAETRKEGLAFAQSVQLQRKKAEKLDAAKVEFDSSKAIGDITTNQNATPEEIYYELGKLPIEDKEIKKARTQYMNSRVSPLTNATAFRQSKGDINQLKGEYGVRGSKKEINKEDVGVAYLTEAKKVQDRLTKRHQSGELNYETYKKLVDELEPAMALRTEQAREALVDAWDMGWGDDEILNTFSQGFNGDESRVDDAFMNYYNAIDILNSKGNASASAKKEFKARAGRDWEDTTDDKKAVVAEIVKEENARDVNSAYKLMTVYSNGNSAQPSEQDILYTMKVNNLTREEVLERLNAN